MYRIQSVKDFANVKSGYKGGWVSGYHNLSQEGDCWVYDDSKVFDKAIVSDNARILQYADVLCSAKVYNMAMVYGNTYISGNAEVYGNAKVYGRCWISDNVKIYGNAKICDYAQIKDNAQVFGDAIIEKDSDYNTFKNNWSSGRYFTYTKSNKMWNVGCFYGTGEELIKKAYKDSELSGKMYEKYVNFVKEQE